MRYAKLIIRWLGYVLLGFIVGGFFGLVVEGLLLGRERASWATLGCGIVVAILTVLFGRKEVAGPIKHGLIGLVWGLALGFVGAWIYAGVIAENGKELAFYFDQAAKWGLTLGPLGGIGAGIAIGRFLSGKGSRAT